MQKVHLKTSFTQTYYCPFFVKRERKKFAISSPFYFIFTKSAIHVHILAIIQITHSS